jgi:hypothetical protein
MPLEVRELHIKVNVNQLAQGGPPAPPNPQKNEEDKDAVIAQCVEEVMEMIQRKKER